MLNVLKILKQTLENTSLIMKNIHTKKKNTLMLKT